MATFDADATAKNLGVHTLVAGWYQCVPPADYPDPEGFVKAMLELDPGFRVLWVVNVWKTPNDGLRKTVSYAIGRHVRDPHSDTTLAAHLLLPTYPRYGIRYEEPIVIADIRDGLSTSERNKGVLPRFVPLTGIEYRSCQKALWLHRNKHTKQVQREMEQQEADEQERASKALHAERAYERQHDSLRTRCKAGMAARTFVSDSLVKLRESAGYKVGEA